MPNAIKWETTQTAVTLEASGGALANDTIVQADDADYNGDTVLATYGWLEFVGTFASSPTDPSPFIGIYVAQQPDGTNFSDAPVTGGTDCSHQLVATIPVRKVATAQRKTVGPFLLPPHDARFYVDNQTGVSLNSGWVLKLNYNNLEGQ